MKSSHTKICVQVSVCVSGVCWSQKPLSVLRNLHINQPDWERRYGY